jgi:hypothetical protein
LQGTSGQTGSVYKIIFGKSKEGDQDLAIDGRMNNLKVGLGEM